VRSRSRSLTVQGQVSAVRFFDDLARTLAEPMPRRRALRVVGVTLATFAVPGIRPRGAGAQSGVCTKSTCGTDQRCCTRVTGAGLETYCCPRPSWQFQCGGQSNGYRCINTCTGTKKFACTAAIAHPASGINGVCCDRRYHSGCVRIGRPAERRPDGTRAPSEEWKPSCCPKGPGFGFCGGLCCEPPNRSRNGVCRCPDGTASLDGRKCCKRGEHAAECFSAGTAFIELATTMDASLVGRKCCPAAKPSCCGTACCAEFGCCGDRCCSHKTSRCASWKGKKTCCPKRRVTNVRDEQICCPAGTISVTLGFPACCPQPRRSAAGGPVSREWSAARTRFVSGARA